MEHFAGLDVSVKETSVCIVDHRVFHIRLRCMMCLTWLDFLTVVKCSPPRTFPDLCSIE